VGRPSHESTPHSRGSSAPPPRGSGLARSGPTPRTPSGVRSGSLSVQPTSLVMLQDGDPRPSGRAPAVPLRAADRPWSRRGTGTSAPGAPLRAADHALVVPRDGGPPRPAGRAPAVPLRAADHPLVVPRDGDQRSRGPSPRSRPRPGRAAGRGPPQARRPRSRGPSPRSRPPPGRAAGRGPALPGPLSAQQTTPWSCRGTGAPPALRPPPGLLSGQRTIPVALRDGRPNPPAPPGAGGPLTRSRRVRWPPPRAGDTHTRQSLGQGTAHALAPRGGGPLRARGGPPPVPRDPPSAHP